MVKGLTASASQVRAIPESNRTVAVLPEPDPKNQQFLNFKARVKKELEEEKSSKRKVSLYLTVRFKKMIFVRKLKKKPQTE